MYLSTLSKYLYVNSNELMITVYMIHYVIQSRSMICASLSGSTMFSLINPMTRYNVDSNIIADDRNLTIMISS